MFQLYRKLKENVNQQLIKPFIESVSPLHEAALGAAIGMFIGLTPTVGIQMWIVFAIWIVCKKVFGIRFDLIIGTALVWISNPFTLFFFYYAFLVTGYGFSSFIGIRQSEISYGVFRDRLASILNAEGSSLLEIMIDGTGFLVIDLGFPMVLGSLFYAVPLAVVSYFISKKILMAYRVRRASKMGLDYETWREKYERSKN